MTEIVAKVVRAANRNIWLSVEEPIGGCGRCNEPGGCRSVQLTRLLQPTVTEFVLPNSIGAVAGDRVKISIADGVPLLAALATYLLPVLTMILAAAAAVRVAPLGQGDLDALSGAFLGLAVGFVLHRRLMQHDGWRLALRVTLRPAGSDEGNPACGGSA